MLSLIDQPGPRSGLSTRARSRLLGILRRLLSPVAHSYCFLEYALVLVRHARALRRAEAVFWESFRSFGHQTTDLHMLAMNYRGKRLLILVSDYKHYNQFIVSSFESLVRIQYVRHSWLARAVWWSETVPTPVLLQTKRRLLSRFLRLAAPNTEFVEKYHKTNGPQIAAVYATEYIDLLHSPNNLDVPVLPGPIQRFREILARQRQDLAGRWCVSVYLRKKRAGSYDVRDSHQAPFREIARRTAALDGFVFLGAESDPALFRGLDNVVGYADFDASRELMDYFFVTQCRLFVCAHSGPVAVAAAFNVPTLITNIAFFHASGFRRNQLAIYKRARVAKTHEQLAPSATFSMPIVAFCDTYHFENAGIELLDNTEYEIESAFDEAVRGAILGENIETAEVRDLEARFRAMLPEGSIARESPSRPTLAYLRSLDRRQTQAGSD